MIATVESPAGNTPVETSTVDWVAELQKTISASRLSIWLQCRLKFFFRYILQIQKPPTPSMHAGSTVHAVLQQWNMARWRREPFSIERFKTFFSAQWANLQEGMKINWNGDEESDRNSAWRALQLYFIRTPIKNNERPQAVEARVEADLARHGLPKLIGIIDLVRAGGRIVDFKLVGRTPDSEQLVHVNEAQLTCYSLLYRELSPRYLAQTKVGAYSGSGVSLTNLHSSATNINLTIDARLQSKMGIQVEAMASAAGLATLTIPYSLSCDGKIFGSTLQSIALSIGPGTNVILTNIALYGMGFINIPYVTNNHASSDITNLVIRVSNKELSF